MQFIGITAVIDAVIALAALLILLARRNKIDSGVRSGLSAFTKYITYTFVFLTLLSITILGTQGQAQNIMFFIADVVLWISLAYMIIFAFQGRSTSKRNLALTIFFIVAACRSIFQLIGIFGLDIALGENLVYILSRLDAWLMYVVWVPVSVYFIGIGLQTRDSLVRTRSLMFAVGLLLITFTWAFRLLSGVPSYILVSGVSIIGFILLLAGVIYRRQAAAMAY